ncbi:MAG: hypothetical protein BBJ60_07730 [Desulfobacterales bacterium S7086C20]|nr:MAG: hypothetical protein BBJ60_07730 [Desulfobacterales bacterium S7086C20]
MIMQNHKGWQNYQRKLRRKELRQRFLKQSLWSLPFLALLILGGLFARVDLLSGLFGGILQTQNQCEGKTIVASSILTKENLKEILEPEVMLGNSGQKIDFNYAGSFFTLETTLNNGLQHYMSEKIKHARSPLIGFVAIEPSTGRILSLTESNNIEEQGEVCLGSQFPAASVFKIVTAAAAIDRCNISADTKLTYNGRRHTLYKNQLTDQTNRYTNSVSLKDSFAKSINPAFGKLGIFYLKKNLLEEYAIRFGFNRQIDFELPVQPSHIAVGNDPYHWAEIACGFNRQTLISPLHAAIMAATIVNDGKLVNPTIVDHVIDSRKESVYSNSTDVVRQVISSETCEQMKELMSATISRGTSQRTFRGYRRDRVLSKLLIGGKTGSIKNRSNELLYDWFVGFGIEKGGAKKLALAVLVVHGKLLRARAQEYARLALRYYFST